MKTCIFKVSLEKGLLCDDIVSEDGLIKIERKQNGKRWVPSIKGQYLKGKKGGVKWLDSLGVAISLTCEGHHEVWRTMFNEPILRKVKCNG